MHEQAEPKKESPELAELRAKAEKSIEKLQALLGEVEAEKRRIEDLK